MTSKFYLISGRKVPFVLVDEEGREAAFDTAEEAQRSALQTPSCQSLGYVIVELDEGIVGVVDL